MSMMQEKMYMDVDDVCAILGVSKTYAYKYGLNVIMKADWRCFSSNHIN